MGKDGWDGLLSGVSYRAPCGANNDNRSRIYNYVLARVNLVGSAFEKFPVQTWIHIIYEILTMVNIGQHWYSHNLGEIAWQVRS